MCLTMSQRCRCFSVLLLVALSALFWAWVLSNASICYLLCFLKHVTNFLLCPTSFSFAIVINFYCYSYVYVYVLDLIKCLISILTAKRVTKPRISLLSRANGDETLLECQVNDYYPDKLTVQWLRNEQIISTSLPDKKLQNADRKEKTFSLISQLAVGPQDQGTLYACKATHNSEEITEIYNVCKGKF